MLTSTDLADWDSQTVGTAMTSLAGGGPGLIAVGFYGKTASSSNGLAWSEGITGTSRHLYDVVNSGFQLVAVGDSGTIRSSEDGVTWSAESSPTTRDLYGVTYGNSRFVAVGERGRVVVSECTMR